MTLGHRASVLTHPHRPTALRTPISPTPIYIPMYPLLSSHSFPNSPLPSALLQLHTTHIYPFNFLPHQFHPLCSTASCFLLPLVSILFTLSTLYILSLQLCTPNLLFPFYNPSLSNLFKTQLYISHQLYPPFSYPHPLFYIQYNQPHFPQSVV